MLVVKGGQNLKNFWRIFLKDRDGQTVTAGSRACAGTTGGAVDALCSGGLVGDDPARPKVHLDANAAVLLAGAGDDVRA